MKNSHRIGIIGDFNPRNHSHMMTNESLNHAAAKAGHRIEVEWVPTVSLETAVAERLRPYDALWCSPGSPYQSMDGALNAIRYAREENVPFLGT